jgi:hypothetical protein
MTNGMPRTHSAAFTPKGASAVVKGERTLDEPQQAFDVHPNRISVDPTLARLLRDPSPDRWTARQTGPQTQKPHLFGVGFLFTAGEPDDYLLSHGQSALSSAWSRFTVLFGMGRGGTDSLWSSGMTGCRTACAAVPPIGKK